MSAIRRPLWRYLAVIVVLVVGALALVLGVALSAGAGNAGAVDPPPSAFAGVDNVILFIGDGMGPNHVQVGRQLNGGALSIDSIPWGGLGTLDTTSLDGVTDSAAAGTALATGQETWNNWVSMGPDANGTVIDFATALERAELTGKATGLITDLELSDATPAVFAAHVPDRDLGEDITRQMAAQGIEALFSGGWSESYLLGTPNVTSLSQLNPYLAGTKPWPAKMYGIFGKTSLAYNIDREEEGVLRTQPTLPQLTQAAVGVLSQDPDGFFVMIEDGSNDWGGHSRDSAWVGAEIRELDQAVKYAYDWAKARPDQDTLIIVEADHETGGLLVGPTTKYSLIAKQAASTEWMWGLIKAGKMTVEKTLATYAGIKVTAAEKALILKNGEMGISDVLATRYGVKWGWSGTDEGDHTTTKVPVMAWGPGSASFAIPGWDNETSGLLLLDAVSH
jgi:alkaline phosphatase